MVDATAGTLAEALTAKNLWISGTFCKGENRRRQQRYRVHPSDKAAKPKHSAPCHPERGFFVARRAQRTIAVEGSLHLRNSLSCRDGSYWYHAFAPL